MGDLHHAVTSLVIDLKRRQPIRLTKKQTWTHKYFSERKSSRNHRWSRQQDNHRIPIFFLNITTKMKRPMLWTINPSRMVVWSGLIKSAFGPYFWQTPANLELSFSILTNEPHEAGWTSIWPLRYWTTASPVMLSAVVTWNVLPFFFYCSGISAGWKTRLISAHSWRFLWEPSDHWLFHGMKPWLAAGKEELNQSQRWKRGAILLKWKVVF